MKLLEAENIYKTYRIGQVDIHALQGVSVDIDAGEFIAIMGPSGSGKSTLMHLLGFLDTPDKGVIRLLDKNVTMLKEEEYAFLRNRVTGFVFQQFNLMTRSTALENVALPLIYSRNQTEEIKKPLEMLKQVGLEDRIQHRPNELSGGQQQRVAIARALVNQPLMILADEPTGNLDSKSGNEILAIFKHLNEKGMTIVMVTHDEKVGAVAERIIRMQDGKIIADERKSNPKQPLIAPSEIFPENEVKNKKYSLKEFQEHFKQAYRMIMSNKLRSALSILGVLIGVACVITILALGRGARQSITEQLSRLGSNLLSVRPGSTKVHGTAEEAATRFTNEDARAIQETISGVKRISPQVTGQGQAVYGNKNWSTAVLGVTPAYASMKNQEPAMGRFFTEEENLSRRRVALIGKTVQRELFGEESPIGKTIKINRINFQVIGLLPSLGGGGWHDQDDVVVIPLMTAMKRVQGKDFFDQIDVEIETLKQMPEAQEAITSLLIRRHRLTPDRYDSFNVRNFADIQAALTSTTKTISILLGCVAAISLLVGGIGIMNVMLVSVKERTREIGLRKAIGATPRDILMQFLVEAVVITFLGGLIGIFLALGLSWLIAAIAGWKMIISLDAFLLAFLFSAGVGIIFGLWPAKQAASLDPIEALRYE
ncbi:MAG: MacB family efflux pump subunit [Omnitrophica bacterium RIFCSPLOWO2_12_FULL_44_17]|uniref:MacB family efflux pump subunit n=1 Tax=Candidatus Danuiimicrobium aquiferis TaxID=1801832 RepID=A0A1G1KTG8_9BACT|nr:MAG: MacB family efflux pump subunit [Omnitrophica bacterium RIFCSPHIGHO2_02_FULL_45_28]OGW91648.1 MAG: MacB family efflux pump subunit [Omnitrophica bacterium RIFCSPHIGHO2_12_FULL_44_12]OGW96207.1 MAG: MacB family efflux pump subunit [Omnitrophica bacterium RIFCSPLOWO2_12_FULL_44_17]OGX02119.1 MAG: MacB family efflux pump subunit [Omnitrophica bacterium RIFCSPLOWO2_02_FULL_44_11]